MKKFLAIVGPTASGKSKLAMAIAPGLNAEIINCDSVQIYKDFNVGSCKPSQEQRELIKHHLIDKVHWSEDYDACRYGKEARQALDEIQARGKIPIVVGGTGLYLRALIQDRFHEGLPQNKDLRMELAQHSTDVLYTMLKVRDRKRASVLHRHDRVRILRALEITLLSGKSFDEVTLEGNSWDWQPYIIYLCPERQWLHQQIAERVNKILSAGLVEEVLELLSQGCPMDSKPMQSIGYRQVKDYILGRIKPAELADHILFATRQYAKRQYTWFNSIKSQLKFTNDRSFQSCESLIGISNFADLCKICIPTQTAQQGSRDPSAPPQDDEVFPSC